MKKHRLLLIIALVTAWLGCLLNNSGAAELYYTNRVFTPVAINVQGTARLTEQLYAETGKLTDLVKGTNVTLNTNETHGIERQVINLEYTFASEAWNAAVNYTGLELHPSGISTQAGWIKGTESTVPGEWGAYFHGLQNQIVFKSSETNCWTSLSNGVRVAITNVLVGSLGNYGPMSNVVEVGPVIDTNFPGEGLSDTKTFYVDITNVYYQLAIPSIWVTPRGAVAGVGGSNVQYSVTGTNIPQGVDWMIYPTNFAGHADIVSSTSNSALISPGTVPTNYMIRATSKDNPVFSNEVPLVVLQVDIVETQILACAQSTNFLSLTPGSSTNVQWEITPSVQGGASIVGSSLGTSIVFNAGAVLTNYTVRAYAVQLTNCYDVCTATVLEVVLEELTFSGTKYHTVKSDDGATDYTGLHWQDPNHDGNASDGRSYPVCFTRNTKMSVSGKWHVEPANPGVTIVVKGDGPGNLDFTNTSLNVSGTNGAINNVECVNAFTNEVDFFDPMSIEWKVSYDNGSTWYNAGTSTNQCYVTLSDPLTTVYHTLAHLGCKNADGQSTSNTTADAIYGEFTDRDVRRVSDGKQMTYWYNDQMGGRETAEILQRSDANGNCESWSALFRDFLKVQGVTADRIMAMPVSSTDGAILVKNWQFNDPPGGTGAYAYIIGTDAIDLNGVPGQGNPNPPGGFNGHWITLFDNQYYDPSYGSAKVIGTDKDKTYEDGALAGYGNLAGTAARMNDTSTNTTSELSYQVDN